MHFSESFLSTLVTLALAGISISVVVLIYLFIKDAQTNSICERINSVQRSVRLNSIRGNQRVGIGIRKC
jgi:hypothetical protein